MAEFKNLPARVQKLINTELMSDEQFRFCILGSSVRLSPDFIVLTTHRVLVVDERRIGILGVSYANIRCNVRFTQIKAVHLVYRLKHRLLRQACLEIEVTRQVHLLDNINIREAKRIQAFIEAHLSGKSTPSIKRKQS